MREALLPVAIGLALGGLVGGLLVRELGPARDLGPDALTQSLLALAAGGVAALAVIAAVTATLLARMDQLGRGPAAQLLSRIPWLPVTAAITVVTAVPLVTGSSDGSFGVLTLVVPAAGHRGHRRRGHLGPPVSSAAAPTPGCAGCPRASSWRCAACSPGRRPRGSSS